MENAGIIDGEKIKRYFNGKYSGEDTSYVDKVFNEDNKEKELKSLLLKQFYESLAEDDLNEKNLDHILHRIHYEINSGLSPQKLWSLDNIIKWTFRIAGILILPLLFLWGMQIYKEAALKKEAWVEIKAPAWTRAQFSLPDGTTGWLNSSSSLKYNENFISDRQVTLTGEAFFDVYRDRKRPFIVNTHEINIKVLGTRFNIASYENEKTVEVVLEEGKLLFNDNELKKSCMLSPNEMVIYNKTLKDFSTEVVQPQKYVAWTEGKLVFRNDPLDVVARRLERWYNIDVEVNVSSAEDLRWRATFIDEGLEEVLSLLKRSLHVGYIIENRNLKPDDTFARKKVILQIEPNKHL